MTKQDAMKARKAREHEAYRRALVQYQRSMRPLPIRIYLGLADVVRAWLKGGR